MFSLLFILHAGQRVLNGQLGSARTGCAYDGSAGSAVSWGGYYGSLDHSILIMRRLTVSCIREMIAGNQGEDQLRKIKILQSDNVEYWLYSPVHFGS